MSPLRIISWMGRTAAVGLFVSAMFAPRAARAQNSALWTAPERASHRANPLPVSASAVDRGHGIFHANCEMCHGPKGHGDGPMSYSLPTKPADLTSDKVQSQTDGALFWKVFEGRGVMPSTSSTLSDDERWSVIDYIRSLSRKGN